MLCSLQIPVEMCGRKPGELGEVSSDSSKAFRELGWKAEKSLHDMCKSGIGIRCGIYNFFVLKLQKLCLNTPWILCTRPVSCFLEQFSSDYISFIFQFICSFLFTLCKCNMQETGTTNKWFFTAFVRFKHRCKMSGVILKCAKSISKGNH